MLKTSIWNSEGHCISYFVFSRSFCLLLKTKASSAVNKIRIHPGDEAVSLLVLYTIVCNWHFRRHVIKGLFQVSYLTC
jgi:hypothetical protein